MFFSDLPHEIVHEILVLAVKLRGIKRALRLRLVNKYFLDATERAIFDSGILDTVDQCRRINRGKEFWQRYLAYRALHGTKSLSYYLRTIRQASECILRHREGLKGAEFTEEELRECVMEISYLPFLNLHFEHHFAEYLSPEFATACKIDEDSVQFKKALLSAAAATSEVELVQRLVDQGFDNNDYDLIFDPPLKAAANSDNLEIISLLLANEKGEPGPCWLRYSSLIDCASSANHIGAIELGLATISRGERVDNHYLRYPLLRALSATTSIEIFKRIFALVRDTLDCPLRKRTPEWREEHFLPDRFQHAARQGALEIMEYLVELGVLVDGKYPDNEYGFSSPISLAALTGHEAVVKFLLDRGADANQSLAAAASVGSLRIVRLLLQHGSFEHEVVKKALEVAVENEDEKMFRLLLQNDAKLDEETRAAALHKAEKEGLESMVALLRDYSQGEID